MLRGFHWFIAAALVLALVRGTPAALKGLGEDDEDDNDHTWNMFGGGQQRASYENTTIFSGSSNCKRFKRVGSKELYYHGETFGWNRIWVQNTPLFDTDGRVTVHWLLTQGNSTTGRTVAYNSSITSPSAFLGCNASIEIHTFRGAKLSNGPDSVTVWSVPGNYSVPSDRNDAAQMAVDGGYLSAAFIVVDLSSRLERVVVAQFNYSTLSLRWHQTFQCGGSTTITPLEGRSALLVTCEDGPHRGMMALSKSTGAVQWHHSAYFPPHQMPSVSNISSSSIAMWTRANRLCSKEINASEPYNALGLIQLDQSNGSVLSTFCPSLALSPPYNENIQYVTTPFIGYTYDIALTALSYRSSDQSKLNGTLIGVPLNQTGGGNSSLFIQHVPTTFRITRHVVLSDIRGEGLLLSGDKGMHVVLFDGHAFKETGAGLTTQLSSVPVADMNYFYLFTGSQGFGDGELLVFSYDAQTNSGKSICAQSLSLPVYKTFSSNVFSQPALGQGRLFHILGGKDGKKTVPVIASYAVAKDDGFISWRMWYLGPIIAIAIPVCFCVVFLIVAAVMTLVLRQRLRKVGVGPQELKSLLRGQSSLQSYTGGSVQARDVFSNAGGGAGAGEHTSNYASLVSRAKMEKWYINSELIDCKSVIGKGAFGTVWLADYKGTEVAVKFLREMPLDFATSAQEYRENVEDFTAEMRLLAMLRHPNIVLFMGGVLAPEQMGYGIVIEYCPMGSLFDSHDREDVFFSPAQKMKIAQDIARGMLFLNHHEPPIIHRDLKSPNLLITNDYTVKITDFGMSRFQPTALPSEMTTTVGSLAWMAPELLMNEPYDFKIDVYSFGVVMWEILVQEKPFMGFNQFILASEVLMGRRPDMPEGIDQGGGYIRLMKRCWAEDPMERPTWEDISVELSRMEPPPSLV